MAGLDLTTERPVAWPVTNAVSVTSSPRGRGWVRGKGAPVNQIAFSSIGARTLVPVSTGVDTARSSSPRPSPAGRGEYRFSRELVPHGGLRRRVCIRRTAYFASMGFGCAASHSDFFTFVALCRWTKVPILLPTTTSGYFLFPTNPVTTCVPTPELLSIW